MQRLSHHDPPDPGQRGGRITLGDRSVLPWLITMLAIAIILLMAIRFILM